MMFFAWIAVTVFKDLDRGTEARPVEGLGLACGSWGSPVIVMLMMILLSLLLLLMVMLMNMTMRMMNMIMLMIMMITILVVLVSLAMSMLSTICTAETTPLLGVFFFFFSGAFWAIIGFPSLFPQFSDIWQFRTNWFRI